MKDKDYISLLPSPEMEELQYKMEHPELLEPRTEQCFCKSYVEGGKVIDCTCGRCFYVTQEEKIQTCGYPNHKDDFCPALNRNCPLLKKI